MTRVDPATARRMTPRRDDRLLCRDVDIQVAEGKEQVAQPIISNSVAPPIDATINTAV
jgi:hypothetical protein